MILLRLTNSNLTFFYFHRLFSEFLLLDLVTPIVKLPRKRHAREGAFFDRKDICTCEYHYYKTLYAFHIFAIPH